VRPVGRRPGSISTPRALYPEIYALYNKGEWCAVDIGAKYGLTAAGVRSLVNRCRHNPSLLEVKS
jgi:hypothetical protein